MIKTKEDWIQAGIDILEARGIDNVRIEAIARKLRVTKGSFYGYFLNRDAFLQALLDYWSKILTSEIIEAIGNLEGSLPEKLQKLLYTVDDKKFDALETSMYAWSFTDPNVEKVVMRLVKDRLDFIASLFLEGGFSQDEAKKRADILHHYLAGCKSFRPLLPKNGSPKRHAQLDHFIKLVTAPVE